VLCALHYTFPEYDKMGIWGLSGRPVIYCSEEAHHSIDKAAKVTGLGFSSVRSVPMNMALQMDTDSLRSFIQQDLASGKKPFLLVGTAGTTGYGAIDSLPVLSTIAEEFGLWFHVDAAYGGGAVLHRELKTYLNGIEKSDSITFDAHKWMSVPMAASLFLTTHKEILAKTFRINTEYMPKEASEMEVVDPYTHSIQWSRRFIGLKVYLSLLFFGWEGYEEVVGHQSRMGDLLRQKLTEHGWAIKNNTPLPVVCFTDDALQDDPAFAKTLLQRILNSGKSWISLYPVNQIPTFRVCITNYNTSHQEIEELVAEINHQREVYRESVP
jgi:glutamate/tyrosine decarboxylase-like PLP-dependent enzyme